MKSKQQKEKEIESFDDILEHVGGWNRYQAILLVISFPFAFIYGYVYFTPVLMLYVPDHRCANASQTTGQCQMYSGKGHLMDCQYGYEYDTMGLFKTAITDYDWVCDNDWIPPFTQAMFFLGGIVGNLAFGVLSDSIGRYPTFFASNIIVMISGIVTPYCTDVYSFSAVRDPIQNTQNCQKISLSPL